MGQSLGGGVAVLIDDARVGLFARLVLSEAGAFPATGGGPNPMSERARTRRAVSPGRDMFVRIVGNKPPLSELAPDALDSYAHWGCWTGPR